MFSFNKYFKIIISLIQYFDLDNVKEDIAWLQYNSEPWSTVEEKWKNTFAYRRKVLQSGSTGAQEITDIFKILKNPLGYVLIDWEFKELYKDSYGKLFVCFEKVFQILVQLRKHHLNKNECLLLEILGNPQQDNFSSSKLHTNLNNFI